MDRADAWFMCRAGFVETVRAIGLPQDDLHFATWDRRLHTAASSKRLQLIPETLD